MKQKGHLQHCLKYLTGLLELKGQDEVAHVSLE